MEIQIDSEKLSKGLYQAQGIVERRMAMPILSNVLIEASADGKVRFTATNLEVGMTCLQPAEVKQPGAVAVGAKIIFEIAKNLKKQKVSLRKLENNWAEMKAGSSEYHLLGMPVDEFQKLPDIKEARLFEVDIATLSEMIDKTIYAASTDDTRYSLNGCFLEKGSDNKLRMVATDGHRLCMIDRSISQKKIDLEIAEGVIIPRKGLLEVKRILENENGACRIGKHGNSMVLQTEEVTLIIRLIDGRFPDYRQVIPKEQKTKMVLDRKSFIECLKRVSIFTVVKTMGIRLQLSKGLLKLTTSNPDVGEAKEEMPVEYKGSQLTIGFNSRYLEDAFSSINSDQVEFSVEDDLSPCIVRPKDDGDYTCVIMPMRI